MRILFAEPNAIINWSYGSVLQDHGHVVLGPARITSEALRVAATAMPLHLALAEIDLSDGAWTGWLLARELRDRWSIPTLFFTTRKPAELPQETVALGLLQKPVMSTSLIASLQVVETLIAGLPAPEHLPPGLVLFS